MKQLRLTVFVFIALIAIAGFVYCDDSKVTVWVDNDIPSKDLKAVHKLNDRLFDSIKVNKPDVMIGMFTESGRINDSLASSIKDTYGKITTIDKDTRFELLHEYLIDNQSKKTATVTLPADKNNKFLMGVDGDKGPVFVSLLVSKSGFKDLFLCFVYLKSKQGWQLYTFHCGLYKVAGKTSVDWYEEAKEMYAKGWDVPAIQRIQIMQSFLRPAPFIQYSLEKEMADFTKKIAAEVSKKYKFPMKANWIKATPMIYGLDTQFVKGKLIPIVVYVTKNPLDRGNAIQDEADEITSKIGKLIPGITQVSDELAYRAFLEPPLDSKKSYKYRSLSSKVIK
jgi:hypothetical protein